MAGKRTGLVLGAGGVLGAAWTAGALAALQEQVDTPLGEASVVVGTSAGSVLASVLRCGVGVDEIVAHQRGAALGGLPSLDELDRETGRGLPPLPRLRMGSLRLLAAAARAPHRVNPWVVASALVPQGRAQHASLAQLVGALCERHPGWPKRPTWIMAVDYESGRRTAFGGAGAPPAELPDAVVASCSIPGWHQPRTIGGRPYVDGGVRSATSLDLLARLELDEVYVLAPMATFTPDTPRSPLASVERRIRWLFTIQLAGEARRVRATGARVTVLTPGPDDLAAIGINLMDPSRRLQVLETSLRTAPGILTAVQRRHLHAA